MHRPIVQSVGKTATLSPILAIPARTVPMFGADSGHGQTPKPKPCGLTISSRILPGGTSARAMRATAKTSSATPCMRPTRTGWPIYKAKKARWLPDSANAISGGCCG